MSLNIYMDVDDTLINCNESVDPRAAETLRQIVLKLRGDYPDSDLYLWSGAGGAYAREMAEKHKLAGFFNAFLGKPDVVIDDRPSSIFPRKAVVWQGDAQWQTLFQTIFSAKVSPSNSLIEVVDEIVRSVKESDRSFSNLYSYNYSLRHPIVFFGDIENAEVLTLGVNPSPGEFKQPEDTDPENRNWPLEMSSAQLALRLVNYFRDWRTPPYKWFTPLETILRSKNCSYQFNAAHIDLSPRATLAMGRFNDAPGQFLNMVKKDANETLPKILSVAQKAKQIWIRGQIVSTGNRKDWPSLKKYIEDEDGLSDVRKLLNKYELHQI